MSIKGGPYAHFQRALKLGNLSLIRATAAELPQVDLTDALAICLVMSAEDDEQYERAAARWLARLVLERPAIGLHELEEAFAGLRLLRSRPEAGKRVLRDIAQRYRLGNVAGLS